MSNFNFAEIPGCVLWLESHGENGLTNKLKEVTGRPCEVYIWEDPNNADNVLMLAFEPELSPEHRDIVQQAIAARFTDSDFPNND